MGEIYDGEEYSSTDVRDMLNTMMNYNPNGGYTKADAAAALKTYGADNDKGFWTSSGDQAYSRWLTAQEGSAAVPGTRDIYAESADSLKAMLDLAPDIYSAEAKYRPKYAQLDWDIQKQITGGPGGTLDFMENTILPASQRITDKARAGQVDMIKNYGADTIKAFLDVDPELRDLLAKMTQSASTGSDSELSAELERQAIEELRAGGDLTPEELRNAQQASRAAWAARGLINSNPAVLDEIAKSEQFRNARKDSRRSFAAAIENMRMSRTEADRAYAGNVATMRSNINRDPMAILMQDPLYSLAYGQNAQTFATQFSNATPQMFNPMNDYAANLNSQNSANAFNQWSTKYQGDISMQIAKMEADAAKRAAKYGLYGDIIGASAQIGAAAIGGGKTAVGAGV